MKLRDKLAIATGIKPPPRRRGLGKKTLAKLAEPLNDRSSDNVKLALRGYKDVAGVGGLNSDWALSAMSEDSDVWQNQFALRSRSRDLFRTDVYFQKYTEELWANVFGSEGITLRMRIKETEDRVVYGPQKGFLEAHYRRRERLANYLERKYGIERQPQPTTITQQTAKVVVGDMDLYANETIEDAWEDWKRRDYCTVAGCLNYNEVRQVRLLSAARDGDFFLRHVRSPSVNKYGYALQLINAEWCDYNLNDVLQNGNVIRMGIERDPMGKRVAYYFIRRSPMDWQFSTPTGFAYNNRRTMYEQVPAAEIIHYARYKDGDSTRPAPWSASVIVKSRHLDKYEEAEVAAARVSACKIFQFSSTLDPMGGTGVGDRPDPTQAATLEAGPGGSLGLPWGVQGELLDPKHPTGNFDLFRKAMLRAWCAGMPGANYNIIANDLEGVNYSSGRLGMLDERELWKLIQKFDIEVAERPIFEAWLEMSLTTGEIPLPLTKFEKFNKPVFRGRRWAWVDPLKEVQSSALQVANKFTSRTRVVEDSDVDAEFEDILFELAEEEMLMTELGMDTASIITGKTPTSQPQEVTDVADVQGAPATPAKPAAKALAIKGEERMTVSDIVALIRATQPSAAAAAGVTVNVPEIKVPPPVVNITDLKLPEQKAPIVNIASARVIVPEIQMPAMPAPIVNVNVQPTPVTVVNKIPTSKKMKVNRDEQGKLAGMEIDNG